MRVMAQVDLTEVIRIVERWEKPSFICLAAGAMTAGELRAAIAVVRGVKAELKLLLGAR